MRRREEDVMSGNLVAMIDVVFQLIIFFVVTSQMQKESVDDRIRLASAPHGRAVVQKDPRDINIDVDSKGRISIMRTQISERTLLSVLNKAVAEYGQSVPVIIRGDANSKHAAIKTVMDTCAKANIWKIKFAALKETAKKG